MPHTMTHSSLYSLTLAEVDAMLDDELLEVTALLLRSARPAYWRRDGDLAGHVYFADETRRWYALDLDDSRALVRAHLAARYEEASVSADIYSGWCSDTTPCGEGESSADAAHAAGWVL